MILYFYMVIVLASNFKHLFSSRYIITIIMDMIKSIPVHMDYVGQGRAEKLYQIIIVLFGVVGLFWGYTIQQFSQAVYILGAGLVLASLLTIPPWGIYRSNPPLIFSFSDYSLHQVQACEVAGSSPRKRCF